jgi:branched-chain amino acid transport system substrate-binding protein
MKYQSDTGEVWMRADDHQLMQPIYIATFTKAGGKDVRIDAEGTVSAGRPTFVSSRPTRLCPRLAGWRGHERQ